MDAVISRPKGPNQRVRALCMVLFTLLFLSAVVILGSVYAPAASSTDFTAKNLPPSAAHPFGTDWMGRDMFARTMTGLRLSILLGVASAFFSAIVAAILGLSAAMLGKKVDTLILWGIDLFLGIPHMLLLILISYALGKGFTGVVTGIILTHWPSLSRLLRGEVLQLKQSPYIEIAAKLGLSPAKITVKHMLPHLLPQFVVGLVLLFPHAILHESGITFLGFGLPAEQPAIGVILSESMNYLATGQWWLAFFPGLMLVITVLLFYLGGESLRKLLSPSSAHL